MIQIGIDKTPGIHDPEVNVVIINKYFDSTNDWKLIKLLFDPTQQDHIDYFESFDVNGRLIDMYDILVYFGFFRSKSEARKNWKRTGQEIPDGFTDIENISKKRYRLTIWKPIEYED